jgi:cephalosporin hydroxylase
MTKPFLTVAMATYGDFDGVYFSIQAHRLLQDVSDCEFIVLDNNPDSEHGRLTGDFVKGLSFAEKIRYIPFTESTGTTQTRERLFKEAEGQYVLITDPHVLVQANGLHRLKEFLRNSDPDMQKNLFTGPLLYDGFNYVATHFECFFRDQMEGAWASAWKHPDGTLVVTSQSGSNTVLMRPLHPEGLGDWVATDIPWPGHEKALIERGYKVAGMDSNDPPFEIPAQGLGLFCSSREHWLGFNPDFRMFGGEECYIHRKYRAAGRKAMCLPFLKWVHRFGRVGGPKYPLTMEGKIRNYLLGYKELGLDPEPIRKHFVDEVKVSQARFDMIAADPAAFTPYIAPAQKIDAVSKSNFGLPLPVVAQNLGEVAEFLIQNPRDLDQHINAFLRWSLECDTAVEITSRRESSAFLLAALGRKACKNKCDKQQCDKEQCKKVANLFSWQEEGDSLIGILQELVKTHPGRPISYTVTLANLSEPVAEIPKTDLLFLDSRHTGERLLTELTMYAPSVSKRIMIHDTSVFGLVGDGNTKGLWWAIRAFLTDNPEWFVAEHNEAQYGMTVLSRLESDRPTQPIKPWPKTDKDGQPCGCGTNLKAWLKKIGIVASEGCSCNRRAKAMDDQGPEWCENNIEIILDWLSEEANNRKLGGVFFRPAVKLVVQRAIAKAKKDQAAGNCG